VLLVALLAGCSPLTPESFSEDAAALKCQDGRTCGDFDWANESTCEATFQADFLHTVEGCWDPVAAQACLDAYEADLLTCGLTNIGACRASIESSE
jgi:hypothetical protein